jgi:hypothetical protein
VQQEKTSLSPAEKPQMEQDAADNAKASWVSETIMSPENAEEHQFFQDPDHVPEESASRQAELQQADPDLWQEDLPQVLSKFRKLKAEGAFLKDFERFNQYKNRFYQLFDQARDQAYQKFLQNREDEKEEFDYQPCAEEKEARKLLEKVQAEIQEEKKRREREMEQNLLKKQDILDEMRKAMQDLPVPEAIKRMNELRAQWRETGPVPPHKSAEIWASYRHWNEVFAKILELDQALYEEELRRNLAQKEEILKGLENLLKMPSAFKAVQYVQHFRKKWAETGPIPREKSKELFEQFKSLLDKIYERRNEEYRKLQELWQKNKEAKEALIAKAQEVTEGTLENFSQYQEKLRQLDELLHQWKQIGRTSPRDAEILWERFAQVRGQLHKRWNEFKKNREEEWRHNLEKKLQLIEQAEKLLNPDNWKAATAEMLKLQDQWKAIGPVGREKSEEVWKKFREIQDRFFEARRAFLEEIPKTYQRNKEAKEGLINAIENFEVPEGYGFKDALSQVKAWRQEFQAIGHVALEDKKSLEERFEKTLERFLKRFQVDRKKAEAESFKMRIQEMTANGSVMLEKLKSEMRNLRLKTEKLRAEMNQLENNLRFFQAGKNAEALRKPFEEKLEAVREQLKESEARLLTVQLALKKAEAKSA